MTLININRGSIGNNPCNLCGELHVPQNKCRHEALLKKITMLSEANRMIPNILQANKEAVETSKSFQQLLLQADKANDFLMEVLVAHGEIGETIKNEYLLKVDTWVKEHFSQGTKGTSGDGNSTPSETSDKLSTEETPPGGSSLLIL